MKTVSGNKFARVLEKQGWQLKRVHGSHHIFCKAGRMERISVPIHGNKPLKSGLLNHLIKLAQLSEQDFL